MPIDATPAVSGQLKFASGCDTATDNNKWYFKRSVTNKYFLLKHHSANCIKPVGGSSSPSDNTRLEFQPCDVTSDSQKFIFEEVDPGYDPRLQLCYARPPGSSDEPVFDQGQNLNDQWYSEDLHPYAKHSTHKK